MSLKTLPVLFLNLGGEMMYILDQRLRAQNIPDEKAKKVIHDILGTMLNKRFMVELFKPQDAYSKKAMRTVFDRLAHASIMRLNSASMDKLYDLMTMALKYQISLSKHPQDIMMVTLNHMDAMREFSRGNAQILEQVDSVYQLLNQTYRDMTQGQYQLIRHTLLSFFQDMHIRVSIFLKERVQTANGKFVLPKEGQVPWGSDTPGTIRFFDENGEQTHVRDFEVPGKYQLADRFGSFELLGDRVTKLGTNMYKTSRQIETTVPASSPSTSFSTGPVPHKTQSKESIDDSANHLAKAELNLLEYMISGGKHQEKKDFRLSLFNTDEEEQFAEIEYAKIHHREILIDASQREQRRELSNLMNEFSITSQQPAILIPQWLLPEAGDKGDELLELMDSA